jgi:hypothetical protein
MNSDKQKRLALYLLSAPCSTTTERKISNELKALREASPQHWTAEAWPYSHAVIELLAAASELLAEQRRFNEACEREAAGRFLRWLRDLPFLPRDIPSWVLGNDEPKEKGMILALWREHAGRLHWQDTAA